MTILVLTLLKVEKPLCSRQMSNKTNTLTPFPEKALNDLKPPCIIKRSKFHDTYFQFRSVCREMAKTSPAGWPP
jgi:hypothetical protein